jgi:hypothetical protein
VPGPGVTAAGLVAVTRPQAEGTAWRSGLDASGWDRHGGLTASELQALAGIGPAGLRRSRARGARRSASWKALTRLSGPLDQAAAVLHHDRSDVHRRAAAHAAGIILQRCADSGQAYWAWTSWDWARLAGSGSTEFLHSQALPTEKAVRPFLVALAYLLAGFTEFQHLGMFNRLHLAHLVFGPEAVDAATSEAAAVLDRWGYRSQVRDGGHQLPGVLAQAFLVNGSPRLQDLTTTVFARLMAHPAASSRPYQTALYALQKVVADLGHCDAPVRPGGNHMPVIEGADAGWTWWVERWHATSPLTPKVRAIIRTIVAKAGQWLAAEHPEITEPGQWTRQTCAAWVAAIDRMTVGDYVQRRDALGARAGQPISPRTKAHFLMATRTFFRDCQEWEWIPRRFDPSRALALPRSVSALIGTDPRVIADDVWAKLLHAGLNIEAADLPGTSAGSYYPMALIRALTLTWLFSGLRSDEISRLRVGCVRLLPRRGHPGFQPQRADPGMVDLEIVPEKAGQGAGQAPQRRVVDRGLAFPQVIDDQGADRLAGDGVTVDQLLHGQLPGRLECPDRGRRGRREGPQRVQQLVEVRAGVAAAGDEHLQQFQAIADGDAGDRAALGRQDRSDPAGRQVLGRRAGRVGARQRGQRGEAAGVAGPGHLGGEVLRDRGSQQPPQAGPDHIAADQREHPAAQGDEVGPGAGAGPAGAAKP